MNKKNEAKKTVTEPAPETQKEIAAEEPKAEARASLVDTLFDVGLTWASYGLEVGKKALETSAKTLEQTAKALGTFGEELGKKSDALKVEGEPKPKAA